MKIRVLLIVFTLLCVVAISVVCWRAGFESGFKEAESQAAKITSNQVTKQSIDDGSPFIAADLTDDQFAEYVMAQVSRAAESQRKISKALESFFTGNDSIMVGEASGNLEASVTKRLDSVSAQQLQSADNIQTLAELLSASLTAREIPFHKKFLASLNEREIPKSLVNSSKNIKGNRLFQALRQSAELTEWFELQLLYLQGESLEK